jgi:hypothetical protein
MEELVEGPFSIDEVIMGIFKVANEYSIPCMTMAMIGIIEQGQYFVKAFLDSDKK